MSRHDHDQPSPDERRTHPRVPAHLLSSLSAQLSGGSQVTLLDLSQGGVRLQTTRHMRPGQVLSVRFSIDGRVITINAAVVRASVVHLHAEEIRYETGLRLCDETSSEQLQVALIECMGRPDSELADEIDCPEDLVFARAEESSSPNEVDQGWLLAGQSRRRQVLEGL